MRDANFIALGPPLFTLKLLATVLTQQQEFTTNNQGQNWKNQQISWNKKWTPQGTSRSMEQLGEICLQRASPEIASRTHTRLHHHDVWTSCSTAFAGPSLHKLAKEVHLVVLSWIVLRSLRQLLVCLENGSTALVGIFSTSFWSIFYTADFMLFLDDFTCQDH